MAWVMIRRADAEDYERVERAAKAFSARHGLDRYVSSEDWTLTDHEQAVEHVAANGSQRLPGYWRACVRRALREPAATGISYGYVGYTQR